MKILIDENVPLAQELFGHHAELVFVNGRDIPRQSIADAQVLICRSVTPVNASLLENTLIEFVGSCTIGTDHLDTEYLEARKIGWAHAPGCNAQSVVEYVTSALAALHTLKPGLRAAVIGCGRVGGKVYEELGKLGMDLVGYDPFLAADSGRGSSMVFTSLEEAMASDVVCIHTPYTISGPYPSEKMISEVELLLLNKGAVLISAGRGGVVSEEAMHAISEKRPDIRWVMDVWEHEPSVNARSLELATIATPHIAGYSLEGRQNGSRQIYEKFCEHFDIAPLLNIAPSRDGEQKQGPFVDLEPVSGSIEGLVLSVYDPRQDDQRMRAARTSATDADTTSGAWFDRLRKDYPERRERSAYRISSAGFPEHDVELVLSLGFGIA